MQLLSNVANYTGNLGLKAEKVEVVETLPAKIHKLRKRKSSKQ